MICETRNCLCGYGKRLGYRPRCGLESPRHGRRDRRTFWSGRKARFILCAGRWTYLPDLTASSRSNGSPEEERERCPLFCIAFLVANGLCCEVTLMTLADKVKQAGVVGAGGGGFPTHVKMASKADTVIANGAECEPLLHKDAVVMEKQAVELVRGMQLAMEAVGAKAGLIGIKAKKKLAVATVTAPGKGRWRGG